eukprot:855603-Pleurochrysis_carterae.AAC.2
MEEDKFDDERSTRRRNLTTSVTRDQGAARSGLRAPKESAHAVTRRCGGEESREAAGRSEEAGEECKGNKSRRRSMHRRARQRERARCIWLQKNRRRCASSETERGLGRA